MTKHTETVGVTGGRVTRDTATGRLVEVTTSKGVSRSSGKSVRSVERASSKRSDALKRLSDR